MQRPPAGMADPLGPHLLMEFSRGVSNHGSPAGPSAGPSAAPSSHRSTPESSRKRPRDDGSSGEDGEGEDDEEHKPDGNGNGAGNGKLDGSSTVAQRSCEECKRRKVKCDRSVPCANCKRRGNAETCAAESTKPKAPRRNNYALASDVERLTHRLAHVEKLLSIRPAIQASGMSSAQHTQHHHQHANPHLPQRANSDLTRSNPSTPPVLSGLRRESPAAMNAEQIDELDSDPEAGNLERAATSLEAAAYDQPSTATHRPVDSLPFFDNLSQPYRSSLPAVKAGRKTANEREEDLELTEEMTSIVAPRGIQSWWSCAAEMGLDLLAETEEDMVKARRMALAEVLKLLPTRQDSFLLVNKYFASAAWILQATSEVVFLPEHERFWQMVEQGRQLEVDPLWLSLYFLIIALAHEGGFRADNTPKVSYSGASPPVCYGAARRLLHLGDWSGAPQVRTIQVVVLMSQWVQTASMGGEASRLLTWLAGAVRVAQALGLHQLGDDPEIMPPDDRAWPPGKNARKRQMALRLLTSLRLIDYSTSFRYRAYLLHPNHITSAPIDNINYADLSKTDWRFTPLPRSTITDASFEYAKWTMVNMALQVFETLTNKATFSYETVLELDAGYRRLLANLPPEWQTIPADLSCDSLAIRWQRHACQEATHNRLVKLHRPFLTRGFQIGSPYRFSSETCVASAKIVIASHHGILDVTTIWFSYSHALTAALVLFADLFNAIDHGLPAAELDTRSEFLVLAYTIFSRHSEIVSPILRGIAQTGAKVISGLFMAEQKRRHLRDNKGGPPPETFAQILQQITRELDPKSPAQPLPPRLVDVPPVAQQQGGRLAPLAHPSQPFGGFPMTSMGMPQQQQPSQRQQQQPPFPPFDPSLPAFTLAPQQPVLGLGTAPLEGLADANLDEGMFDWSWLDVGGGPLLAGNGAELPGVTPFDEMLTGW